MNKAASEASDEVKIAERDMPDLIASCLRQIFAGILPFSQQFSLDFRFKNCVANGMTERRNDGTTERRNNGTTERRNDGTTERRNDGTTERRTDPHIEMRGRI